MGDVLFLTVFLRFPADFSLFSPLFVYVEF